MAFTFLLYVLLREGPFGHFMSKFLGAGWRQNLGQEAGEFGRERFLWRVFFGRRIFWGFFMQNKYNLKGINICIVVKLV
jgi:hypothetical protein